MNAPRQSFGNPSVRTPPLTGQAMLTGFDWENKRIMISKAITTREDAQDMIDFIQAMMQLLPAKEAAKPTSSGHEGDEDGGEAPE